jgi:hypothetical protein
VGQVAQKGLLLLLHLQIAATYVLILAPTRELAVQVCVSQPASTDCSDGDTLCSGRPTVLTQCSCEHASCQVHWCGGGCGRVALVLRAQEQPPVQAAFITDGLSWAPVDAFKIAVS